MFHAIMWYCRAYASITTAYQAGHSFASLWRTVAIYGLFSTVFLIVHILTDFFSLTFVGHRCALLAYDVWSFIWRFKISLPPFFQILH